MSESHGLQFNVDTSGIAGGLAAYKSAVDGIFSSLSRFEQTATKTFDAVNRAASNKANLSDYAKSMQGLGKIDIDSSAARKISQLSAAVAGFKAPTAGQSDSLKAFFKALNSIPDLANAAGSARSIAALSASLSNFKVPSASSAANMRAFFRSLQGLPDISGSVKSINAVAKLGSALGDFKAPSAASAANLVAFGKAVNQSMPLFNSISRIPALGNVVGDLNTLSSALKNLRAPSAGQVTNLGNLGLVLRHFSSTNINGLSRIGTSISGISNFRAPTPSQIRNLSNFIDAIDKLHVPQNAGAIANGINQITSAATRANQALGGFRAGLGGLGGGFSSTSRGAREATLNMMGLQNAFNSTFQVGSVLRSLLGSLTLGELGREFFEASNAAMQFNAQMNVLNTNTNFAAGQLDYINKVANEFGMDMLTAEKGFSKVSIAASKTGISVSATRSMFEGFSSEMTVLGTSAERQNDVWLALQQVMNKGYLAAEELNQQLNEHLPGAMAYASEYANSLGMSLQDALAKKAMKASDVLTFMAQRMKEDFGPSVNQALDRPAAQMTILKNNITSLFQEIGKQGGNQAFATLLKTFNEGLNPEATRNFAIAIGEGLVTAVNKLSDAFKWLHDNWDSIKGPLGTTLKLMGEWMVVSAGLQIGRYMISPLLGLATTLSGSVLPSLRTFNAVMTGLSAGSATQALAAMGASGTALSARLAAARSSTLSLRSALALTAATSGPFSAGMLAMQMAGSGLIAGLRSIVNFLGGPYTLTIAAAAGAVYMLYNEYSNLQGLMENSKGSLTAVNKLLEQNHLETTLCVQTSDMMNITLNNGTTAMDAYTARMDKQTNGLYSMAVAARAAAAALLEKKRAELIGEQAGLKANNTKYIGQQAGVEWSKGNYGRAIGFGLYGAYTGARQAVGMAPTDEETGGRIVELDGSIKALNNGLKELNSDKWLQQEMDRIKAGQVPLPATQPVASGDGGKAARKAQSQLESFASGFNSFMSGIDSNDKVSSLLDKWSATLTSGAKALLGPAGYAEALKTVRDYSNGAGSAAQGLINALSSGKLDKVAIRGLKKMGVTPEQIISDLKDAIVEQDEKITETLANTQAKKYKTFDDALKKLSESNPVLKVGIDFNDNLLSESKGLLSASGMMKFLPTFEKLHSGAISADQATQALIDLLNDPKAAKSGLTSLIPQITQMLQDQTRVRNENAAAAERESQFGYKVIKAMQDEATQMRLSTKQQEVFAKLQEAIDERRSRGLSVQQAEIDILRQRIEAQQKFNETLRKTNELHDANGIRQWASQTMQASDLVNKLDNTLASGLEETLYKLGTEGKFSFSSLINSMQADIMRFVSQSLTKQFLNGLFGGGIFGKDGSMSQKSPSFFNGFMGATLDPNKRMTQDQYAGMSSANDNAAFNPTWDSQSGMLTAIGGGAIPQQAQAMATALRTAYTYDATQALRVNVANANEIGVTGAAGSPSNALGVIGLGGTPSSVMDANSAVGGTADPSLGKMGGFDLTSLAGEGTGGFSIDGINQLNTSFGMMNGNVATAATNVMGLGNEAIKSGGLLGGLFGQLGGLFKSIFGGGGSGGLLGGLGSLFKSSGPTGMAGVTAFLGFREGGISGSAVGAPFSAGLYGAGFSKAPHFSEGTPSTGQFSGGMPAVLHQNEAIIPLSRGRSIPVEFSGGAMGRSQQPAGTNITFNVTSPNPDSFRRSKSQLATQAYAIGAKATRRNM